MTASGRGAERDAAAAYDQAVSRARSRLDFVVDTAFEPSDREGDEAAQWGQRPGHRLRRAGPRRLAAGWTGEALPALVRLQIVFTTAARHWPLLVAAPKLETLGK